MIKKILSLVAVFAILLSLAACAPEETEYGYAEIRIGLDDSFSEHDSDGVYDVAYSDGRIVVGIIRMSFAVSEADGVSATMSPRRFAEYYKGRALEGISVSETVEDGDVVYYTYELDALLGETYTYFATFFKTPYAYFVITYILPSEEFGRNGFDSVLSYAHTTRVDLSGVS